MVTISAIIPHYNHGEFLRDAVTSFANQSYPPIEIIVIDDGSSPEHLAIAEQIERECPTVQLVRHHHNQGSIAAHNTGLFRACGEFAAFRGADDLSLPGFLETAAKALADAPNAALFCGDVLYFDGLTEEGQVESLALSAEPAYLSPEQLAAALTPHHLIHGATVVARTDRLRALGGFRPEHRWYGDWFPFHMLALRHGACYAPRPVSAFRLRSISYGNAGASQKANQLDALKQLASDIAEHFPDLFPALKKTGLLGFFGPQLPQAIQADPELAATFAPLIPAADCILPERAGVPGAIRARLGALTRVELDRLANMNQIIIYGAGGHTCSLLQIWQQQGLPLPTCIATTDASDSSIACEIRQVKFSQLNLDSSTLIVISSKSYESEMAANSRRLFPQAKLLTFWNRGLSTL